MAERTRGGEALAELTDLAAAAELEHEGVKDGARRGGAAGGQVAVSATFAAVEREHDEQRAAPQRRRQRTSGLVVVGEAVDVGVRRV